MQRCLLLFAIVLAGAAVARTQYAQQHIAAGSILIADEKLGDPNFAQTVVLIVQEDSTAGALGIIINRKTDMTLAKAFPNTAKASTDPIYQGGPVDESAAQALMRSPTKVANALPIAGDVYLTTDQAAIEKAVRSHVEPAEFRLYLGYAGWAPGQLEMERRKGAWVLENNAVGYAFDKNPDSLWMRLYHAAHTQIARATQRWANPQASLTIVSKSALFGFQPRTAAAWWNRQPSWADHLRASDP